MKVLILGCGPAGLIAAEAVAAGLGSMGPVRLVSRKKKSPLFGCQYLHAPIPKVSFEGAGRPVKYELRGGSPEDYRQKVYGDNWKGTVSPDEYGAAEEHMAWDLRAAYDVLWGRWHHKVMDADVLSSEIPAMLEFFNDPELVISTIPAPALCRRPQEHAFEHESIWAIGDAPELRQYAPIPVPEFTVICEASPDISWYRAANVFGHKTVEWPGERRRPPLEGVVPVNKPLKTDCDCHPEITRMGRYGRWEKGYLTHQVWADVEKVLSRGVQPVMF